MDEIVITLNPNPAKMTPYLLSAKGIKNLFFVAIFPSKFFYIFLLLFILLINSNSFAQITANTSGFWSDGATWVGGVVPTSNDSVRIANNIVVTVNATGAVCRSLRIGNNTGDGELAFSGTSSLATNGIITLGIPNSSGTITMDNNALLICASILEGDPGFSGIYNSNIGTIIFTGTFIMPVNLTEFDNLTINGNGEVTVLNANIDIKGDLNINEGILNLSIYTANRLTLGGTLTVANGATLRIGGTNTLPANFATHAIGSTSTILYFGTIQNIAPLNSGQKYGNLSLTTDVKTILNNITVAGTLTFGGTSNRLAIGNNTLTLEGAIAGSQTGNRNFRCSAGSNLVLTGNRSRTLFLDQTTPGTTNALNNLTINHSTFITTLGNNVTVAGALAFTNGKLAVASTTLTLSGTVANTVTGGLVGSATSNLIFNGTASNATISMDQTTLGVTNRINNLTIDCDPQILTLGNPLQLSGTLQPTSGSIASSGNLTLLSSAARTAYVAAGASSGGYVTGDVTVERFIATGRKWHFLSVPTTSSQTISQAWQEGAAVGTSISTGFGTWITSNVAGATANGYDHVSFGPSLRTFVPAGNTWITPANTTDVLSMNAGYMIFVRGDRGSTSTNRSTSATILRTTGALNQGDQIENNVGADQFASIANTFSAAIDFRSLYTTGTIDPVFYVWDPKLGGSRGLGGYQTLVLNSGNYIITPGGGSYGSSGSISNNIQSGQAFMVYATGAAGTLQLIENAKSSSNNLVSRPLGLTNSELRINLIDANKIVVDGVQLQINPSFNKAIDKFDARKIVNINESFCIASNKVNLAVERRPELLNNDTVFFNSFGLRSQQYQLEIIPGFLQNASMLAFLKDNYTGISTALSLADTNRITVAVNADAASKAINRFSIIFKGTSILPVTFIAIKATEKVDGVAIDWKTAHEVNIKNYILEKSLDGRIFSILTTVMAKGNSLSQTNMYNWIDEAIREKKCFYRIKSVDNNGSWKYSPIVVITNTRKSEITVFPNPVINKQVNVKISTLPKGKYCYQVYTNDGQAIATGSMNVNGNNEKLQIQLPATTVPGQYQLKMKGENDFIKNIELLIL